MKSNDEQLKQMLSESLARTIEWIKFADAKAAVVGTIAAVYIGLSKDLYVQWWDLLTHVAKSPSGVSKVIAPTVALYLFTYLILRTLWFALMTVRSRTTNPSKNIFFYGYISKLKLKEFGELLESATAQDLDRFTVEQIHANSQIASKKFRSINQAVLSVLFSTALLLIAGVVISITHEFYI